MKDVLSKENLKAFKKDIHLYLETQATLLKVVLIEKLSEAGTYILTSVSLILALLFCCFLFSLGFAFWYGENIGPIYIGFFLASGFFIFVGFLIAIFRKRLFTNHVMRILVSLFNEDSNSKD